EYSESRKKERSFWLSSGSLFRIIQNQAKLFLALPSAGEALDDNKLAFENAYTFFIVNCLYTNGLYAKSPTHSGNPMKDLKNHYQNIVTGFGKGGNTL